MDNEKKYNVKIYDKSTLFKEFNKVAVLHLSNRKYEFTTIDGNQIIFDLGCNLTLQFTLIKE